MQLRIPTGITIPADVESHDWLGTGGIGTFLVPDYIFGISMKKAGYIHDKMYEAQYPKEECDDTFRYNMFALIENSGKSLIIRSNAREIADFYYHMVDWFGQAAYDACAPKENDELNTEN